MIGLLYALIVLGVFSLFSIARIRKSYYYESKYNEALTQIEHEKRNFEKQYTLFRTTKENLNKVSSEKESLEEKLKSQFASPPSVQRAILNEPAIENHASLVNQYNSLLLDHLALNEQYDHLLADYEKTKDQFLSQQHALISMRRGETWNEILKRRGSNRFQLSDSDLTIINYPDFHPDQVYIAPPTGKKFHAVHWCYTLDVANHVKACSMDDAIAQGYKPCRQCVAPGIRGSFEK